MTAVNYEVLDWAHKVKGQYSNWSVMKAADSKVRVPPHLHSLQPIADEIIRIYSTPEPTPKPQIEYRDRDRIITKKEWWPGIAIGVFLSIMTYGVYSWVKFYVQ